MPLLLLSLAGCSNETSSSSEAEPSYEVKWATPTGAPTLAFYNQASNENWLSSSNPAKDVLPHFADNAYDALVFDGSQALTNIATNNRNYVLAEWISGGTFYVVSTQHDASKTWDSKPRVDAFMNMGNVSKAFRDLAKSAWSWGEYASSTDGSITYGAAVSDVQKDLSSLLQAGSVENDPYDYYILAEPAYSALMSRFKAKGLPLNLVYDIQAEFKKAHDGADVPAAAIFVNKTSYVEHKDAIDAWLNVTKQAIQDAASDLAPIASKVAESDEEGNINKRFGLHSSAIQTMINLHGATSNPFHYHTDLDTKQKKMDYANSFQTALGAPVFDSNLFLG